MSESAEELGRIRARIDQIDTSMHDLLLERGGLIERLRQVKGVAGRAGTTAMRPAREAQMMNALAARHSGPLPFRVVERLWREIIAGFTQLQAPFSVVLAGAEDVELVEIGRFYFGVTTPLTIVAGAAEVLERIADDDSAVGVIADQRAGGKTPWWVLLAGAGDSPARVVAKLPFFAAETTAGALALTGFVLSRAPVMPSGADRSLFAVQDKDTALRLATGLGAAEMAASHGEGAAALHLLDIGGCHGPETLSGLSGRVRWLGGYGVAQKPGGAA